MFWLSTEQVRRRFFPHVLFSILSSLGAPAQIVRIIVGEISQIGFDVPV